MDDAQTESLRQYMARKLQIYLFLPALSDDPYLSPGEPGILAWEQDKKCLCAMGTLMREGCQCGGV